MRVILTAVLIAGLASCCSDGGERQGHAPPGVVALDQRKVTEAIMGMYGAFQQKDVAKVAAFMTPDSTCYDAKTSVLLKGRQAVIDHFSAILAEHKPGEVWESSIEGMNVTVSDDMANATYQVKTSAGGLHAVAAVTHVFQRVDGRWLAVHLHRSWNVAPK